MFVTYTQDEINELITADSKNKKAAVVSQEDKLLHSIKHVRLFDDIEMTDTLNIVSDIKTTRYKNGLTKDNAAAFVKFYEALFVYTANKLLWFEMV